MDIRFVQDSVVILYFLVGFSFLLTSNPLQIFLTHRSQSIGYDNSVKKSDCNPRKNMKYTHTHIFNGEERQVFIFTCKHFFDIVRWSPWNPIDLSTCITSIHNPLTLCKQTSLLNKEEIHAMDSSISGITAIYQFYGSLIESADDLSIPRPFFIFKEHANGHTLS